MKKKVRCFGKNISRLWLISYKEKRMAEDVVM
jgi:hypothetical protein